jgi:hypothetical protein
MRIHVIHSMKWLPNCPRESYAIYMLAGGRALMRTQNSRCRAPHPSRFVEGWEVLICCSDCHQQLAVSVRIACGLLH